MNHGTNLPSGAGGPWWGVLGGGAPLAFSLAKYSPSTEFAPARSTAGGVGGLPVVATEHSLISNWTRVNELEVSELEMRRIRNERIRNDGGGHITPPLGTHS